MQPPPLRGPKTTPTRRFSWSLSTSATVHGAAFGIATLLGGWAIAVDASEPAQVSMRPIRIARPDFEEPVENEAEVVEVPPDLEAARLVEFDFADAPGPPVEPELRDPLVGAMWVTDELAWRVEPTEPVIEEVHEGDPPVPPAETAPAEVEIALQPAEESEVVRASVLEAPAPRYPRIAIRNGETGTVECRIFVSARGSVTRVEVVRSSGHRRLDDAAVEALLAWRFTPRLEDGRGIATTILHPVTFVLEGD